MALHRDFPLSPYDILPPDLRWFPAAEELRSTAYEKLLPPLVAKVREKVKTWRDAGYAGASTTSRALLAWWFQTDHLIEQADGTQGQFRYYFAQREAVETVIWLYDVRSARDKFDLLRFDASGAVSSNMFDEDWPRFVVKMATGAGKTKVLSLLMAWSYFHKLYEEDSTLARNFLLIAPNIIVLDRLRADFDGLHIFFNDPVLPDNGHAGRNWRDDFQIALHIQDDVRIVRRTDNIFLTNIHRVYLGEVSEPSLDDDDLRDYFLSPFGAKPVGKTTDSNIDLGEVVREIDELAVFNDEAHHIHDPRMAWFQCIQDIHHRLLQKDLRLAIQMDVTATPRHDNGAIFVQTVSDYPLVEAIAQNVVKHPVLPDVASRAKLAEHKSPLITEKYADYLQLGVEEWRKSYAEHEKLGRKWIATDLGKFGIHTTRKRLIHIQREKKAAEQDFRAFEVLNLGRYERQAYLNVGGRLRAEQKAQALAQKENEFRELILRAYKATGFGGTEGAQAQDGFFHGARNGRLVVIGPINLPVGRLFVEEVITECRKRGASRVDMLAFEFEMGLFPAVLEEAHGKGIDLSPKYIPTEVFDKRAVDKGQVVFHDISFVEATPRYDKKDRLTVKIELTDFSVYYTQGAAEAAITAMKGGKSEVMCEQGQLYKVSKNKDGIVTKERLTKHWTDWVDYWAVDFDYMSRKEIIKVRVGTGLSGIASLPGFEPPQGELTLPDFEERWTGGYIFENEWQSFRIRQNRRLELITQEHTYDQPGRYTVAVKVIDIFGNDTMTLVPVSVG